MAQNFTAAWLAGAPAARHLLDNPLLDLEATARRLVAARAGLDLTRTPADVLSALHEQERRRPLSPSRQRNLSRLTDGALVVATGQQVGLFGGPLYALHKAASAIAWAAHLEALLDRPVVPLFWLQTEDADFEEVKAAHLPGPDGLVNTTLEPGPALDPSAPAPHEARPLDARARVSLGHRLIGPSIAEAIATLRATLSGPKADEVLALMSACYRPEATLGEAFGELFATLFADHGLLVFDPRQARAAHPVSQTGAFIDTIRFALDRHEDIHAALAQRSAALEAAGFAPQVPIRDGVSLVCFHPEGPAGDRYRLARLSAHTPPSPELDDTASAATWTLSGRPLALSRDELELALRESHRFSTTALLRPLLQDRLFPTIAYVGGPGEVAYLAELPPLYALAGLPMPLVLPRARVLLSTPASRRLTEQLGLPDEAWTLTSDAVRAHLAARHVELAPVDALEAQLSTTIDATLASLASLAEALGDGQFGRQADKARDQLHHTAARLFGRLRSTALDRDTEERHRLSRLMALIRPNDGPQERTLSLPPFAAAVGAAALASRLVEHATSLLADPASLPRFADLREVNL